MWGRSSVSLSTVRHSADARCAVGHKFEKEKGGCGQAHGKGFDKAPHGGTRELSHNETSTRS